MNLIELQAELTTLHPNYELVVHWRFTKEGNEYEVKWRPEGNLGLLSEFPVEITGKQLPEVMEEVLRAATEFKVEMKGLIEKWKESHAGDTERQS